MSNTVPTTNVVPFEDVDYAVLKTLWQVPALYTRKLSKYYLLDVKLGDFENVCHWGIEFPWKEYLLYQDKEWEVSYYHCSYDGLSDFPSDTLLLISMRECEKTGLRIALVSIKQPILKGVSHG